jgi:serine/threonine-protein kinase
MGLWGIPTGSRPAALTSALDDEIAKIERLVVRGWLAIAALGLVVGAVAFLLVPGFGIGPMLGVLPILLFFLAVDALGRRRKWTRALFWVQVAVEGALPWAFVYVLTRTQGAEYALGSWVPPMLYGGVICVGILRLRPLVPFFVGVVASVQYELLYALVVRHHLSDAAARMPLFGVRMQLVRGLSIVVSGALASALAAGLRAAIGKAAKTARAQDLFGKYRIEHRIASGGMATVYAATYCPEGGFARPVAIKRIHPHLAREPSFVDAFRNEAELGARLVHPNIVQVLDFGRVEETYFLAMEFVDGVTLGALMRHARAASIALSPSLVAWMGGQMLEGLAYSHAGACDQDGNLLRIVHRDLSPANVLVSKNGQVKLSDFGIARALRDTNAYHTVSVAGHMSYMAPEQASGLETDERSDLFAIATILWELVCGTPLFRREQEAATLLAVLNDPIPAPSSLRAGLDAARWDAFFALALEREPGKRYQAARQMLDALRELEETVGAPRPDELLELVAGVTARTRVDAARSEAPTISVPSLPEPPDGSQSDATRTEGRPV